MQDIYKQTFKRTTDELESDDTALPPTKAVSLYGWDSFELVKRRLACNSSGLLQIDPTSLSGFVPYTGATTDVDLGVYNLTAASLKATGDGLIWSDGTTGTTPASGVGTRMMWIPAKGAFRAGYVSGTEWDNANIGSYSFAAGSSCTASAFGSTAIGIGNIASGLGSFAMGYGTTTQGISAIALGYYVVAQADNSIAFGVSYTNTTANSLSIGFGQLDYLFTATAADFYNSSITTTGTLTVGGGATAVQLIARGGASQTSPTTNIFEIQNGSSVVLYGFYNDTSTYGSSGIKWRGGSKLCEQSTANGNYSDRMLFLPNGDNFQVLNEAGTQYIATFSDSDGTDFYVAGTKRVAIVAASTTFNHNLIVGNTTNSQKLTINSNYAGTGEIPAGVLSYGTTNLAFIADGAGGNGNKFVIDYYNGSAWYSALEVANVASGYSTLYLLKSGGSVAISGTNNLYFNAVTEYINSANAGYLDLHATTEIRLDDNMSTDHQYYSKEKTDTVSSGAVTVSWNDGNCHYTVLDAGANIITLTNPKAMGRYILILKQNSTGAAGTVTFSPVPYWAGGTAPTLTATNNAVDVITLAYSTALGKYVASAALDMK